jgi:uncharacterized membrane protein SpoIIM required for sporulation
MAEFIVTLFVLVLLIVLFVFGSYAMYQLTLSEDEAGDELMDYVRRRLSHHEGE